MRRFVVQVATLDRMMREAVTTCLEQPLVAAEAAGRPAAAVALAQAWLAYLASMQARQVTVDEAKLVDLAVKVAPPPPPRGLPLLMSGTLAMANRTSCSNW